MEKLSEAETKRFQVAYQWLVLALKTIGPYATKADRRALNKTLTKILMRHVPKENLVIGPDGRGSAITEEWPDSAREAWESLK